MRSVNELLTAIDDPERTDEAVAELYDMGIGALEELYGAILDEARSPKVRELSAEIVASVVPDGVERLLTLLQSSDDKVAELAAWGLRWNHEATLAEPALFRMLKSENGRIRFNVMRALRYIHVDLQTLEPHALERVNDTEPGVRVELMRLLLHLADCELAEWNLSTRALDALARRARRDEDADVRELAGELQDVLIRAGSDPRGDGPPGSHNRVTAR